MNRQPFERSVVLQIVELFNQGYGATRIQAITGIERDSIRNILRGKSNRKITGGRLANGKREEAKWRGGRNSFEPESDRKN